MVCALISAEYPSPFSSGLSSVKTGSSIRCRCEFAEDCRGLLDLALRQWRINRCAQHRVNQGIDCRLSKATRYVLEGLG